MLVLQRSVRDNAIVLRYGEQVAKIIVINVKIRNVRIRFDIDESVEIFRKELLKGKNTQYGCKVCIINIADGKCAIRLDAPVDVKISRECVNSHEVHGLSISRKFNEEFYIFFKKKL